MATVTDLIERRASLHHEMQDLVTLAPETGLSAEDTEKFDRLDAQILDLDSQIERFERHLARNDVDPADRPGLDETTSVDTDAEVEARAAEIVEKYFRRGMSGLTYAEQEQMSKRAQTTTSGAAGGYLIPEKWGDEIKEAKQSWTPILNEVSVIETASGEPINWPTADNDQIGEIVPEGTAVTEQDLVFGTAKLSVATGSSKMIRVQRQLLQDEAFGLQNYLTGQLARRLGKLENQKAAIGTGTGEPLGIIPGATVGVTSAGAITLDDLIDLEASVHEDYLDGAKYMFNRASLAAFKKLKDTTGRLLWQPSMAVGEPNTINGYPYIVSSWMANAGAGTDPVAFGNFKDFYLFRLVRGVAVQRLEERYAEFIQVGFLGWERFGGVVQDAAAVKKLRKTA